MDDVDAARADRRFEEDIKADLAWLGMDWDGKPVRSSQWLPQIHAQAGALLGGGHAFPCVCSRGDIRRANAGKADPLRYPGTCRGRFNSVHQAERSTGQRAGLRFCVDGSVVRFEDARRGEVQADVASEAGDFLIVRRDGYPSYQLGIVVVDHLLGVNEVVRGADLLDSTPRQVLLLEALGWPRPRHLHVPLVCDSTGRRLSKTEGALSLRELRAHGVDARRIVQWCAACAGQEDAAHLQAAADLVPRFRSERLGTDNILLPDDPLKLLR